ncbi:sensor histidine kinase [Sciscionella sediminilitoris]|uniref:sensor histidine kinase n=1 Tax=Sciscionella sediminilitoris TaxID=1445613 RepID=UPI000691DBF0|nr:histidine kinase [Sciscionella sp. SE31]
MLTRFREVFATPVRRDLLAALTTFALGIGFYLAGVASTTGIPLQGPYWSRVLLFGVACAAQLLRSWSTFAAIGVALACVLADGLLGPTLPMVFVVGDVVFSVVLYTSRRTSRIAIAVVLLAGIAVSVLFAVLQGNWRLLFPIGLQVFAIALVPMWWALNVRSQAEIAIAERERAVLDRRAAVDGERARMARDLHDVIAAHLSAIAVRSEAALLVPEPQARHEALTAIRGESLTALEEMRAMIGLLRAGTEGGTDSRQAPRGLAELAPLLESVRASGSRVHAELDIPAVPAAVDLAGYRILSEALANVTRHAPGAEVRLRVRAHGDRLELEVRNALTASGGRPGTGMGVTNMRERASDVGGTTRIGMSGDQWLVHAELPLTGAVLGV